MILLRIVLFIVFMYFAGALFYWMAAGKTDAAMTAFLIAVVCGFFLRVTRRRAL